jgi:ribonuclease M5
MIKVNEVIIVEGRYDKNTLSQFVDGTIIETCGFGIFSDKEKLNLLRRLAEKRGLVVLTDSDGAGFVIRNYLKGSIDPKLVKHAYIPDINGKERRKTSPSKEGKLGVEGMSREVIETALTRAGVLIGDNVCNNSVDRITKADLFELGLSGGEGSSDKRLKLLKELQLPEKMSPNALLEVLNALMTRDEFLKQFNKDCAD